MKLLLTCEHGGHDIPGDYRYLFTGATGVLNSHRGYDPGALDLFYFLAPLADFSKSAGTSRLLVELNRSLTHPKLFSAYVRHLHDAEKRRILDAYYYPYRNEVVEWVTAQCSVGEEVLHLSVHSFTPVLDGRIRQADIGLLYDPSRLDEQAFSAEFARLLKRFQPSLKIRMNYPYKGISDGFTTFLRKQFRERYSGIEIEVNQRFAEAGVLDENMKTVLKKSLEVVLNKQE